MSAVISCVEETVWSLIASDPNVADIRRGPRDEYYITLKEHDPIAFAFNFNRVLGETYVVYADEKDEAYRKATVLFPRKAPSGDDCHTSPVSMQTAESTPS